MVDRLLIIEYEWNPLNLSAANEMHIHGYIGSQHYKKWSLQNLETDFFHALSTSSWKSKKYYVGYVIDSGYSNDKNVFGWPDLGVSAPSMCNVFRRFFLGIISLHVSA
jgi:hypothetical protein